MILLPLDFTIQTERLCLRIPTESDLPGVFSATRYPGFNDGMLWDPPATIEELREPFERGLKQWADGVAYHFSVDAAAAFVARIALRPSDEAGILDIGYWTHPEHQGKGYMTEAVGVIVNLGFETMNARAIIAECADWNIGSRRILEKLGFHIVRTIPGGFVKPNRVCDEIWYRRDR